MVPAVIAALLEFCFENAERNPVRAGHTRDIPVCHIRVFFLCEREPACLLRDPIHARPDGLFRSPVALCDGRKERVRRVSFNLQLREPAVRALARLLVEGGILLQLRSDCVWLPVIAFVVCIVQNLCAHIRPRGGSVTARAKGGRNGQKQRTHRRSPLVLVGFQIFCHIILPLSVRSVWNFFLYDMGEHALDLYLKCKSCFFRNAL